MLFMVRGFMKYFTSPENTLPSVTLGLTAEETGRKFPLHQKYSWSLLEVEKWLNYFFSK